MNIRKNHAIKLNTIVSIRIKKHHQFTSFKTVRKGHTKPQDYILTKERILQQFAMLCGMY